MLTGSLRQDSPALSNSLRRMLSHREVARLELLYSAAFECGAGDEGFPRPVQQNFNPRPARIALLVLHEGRAANCTALGAAMIACAVTNEKISHAFPVEAALATFSQHYPSIGADISQLADVERIALAVALDDMRHARLFTSSKSKESAAARAKLLLSQSSNFPAESARLREMLQHALDQQSAIAHEGESV